MSAARVRPSSSSPPTRSRARSPRPRSARPSPADCAACGPTPRSARARWPTVARERSTPCCRAAASGEARDVTGAGGRRRTAAYGIVDAPEGLTAIIEVAEVVGITDPDGMATAVTARSTGGVGELIAALLDAGVRRFMIGLGGSSTNDGGAGMLAALGLRLVDGAGEVVAPTPAGLAMLAAADAGGLDARLGESAITIMSDVNNPLCGERGATAIFGPQKGVRADEIAAIDATLARFAALAERALRHNRGRPAGGGRGRRARLRAATRRGLVSLRRRGRRRPDRPRRRARGRDWAFTGEGRTDAPDAAAQGAVRRRRARPRRRRADHAALGRGRCRRVAGALARIRRLLRVAFGPDAARRLHRRRRARSSPTARSRSGGSGSRAR